VPIDRLIALLLTVGCLSAPCIGQAEPADLVFTGGRVYTVAGANPWADAVAVRQDRIAWVGDQESLQDWIGPETRVIDLQGGLLLPGFQDSHLHLHWGGLKLLGCNLEEGKDADSFAGLLKDCAARLPGQNDWLVAGQWNRNSFPDGKPPSGFLDELFPNRPVVIEPNDGHSKWVNRRALALAGIDRTTITPDDGYIERDPESGELTGMLGGSAMSLIERVQPPPSDEHQRRAIVAAADLAATLGITSAIEPGVTGDQARLFQQLAEAGRLKLRILMALAPRGGAEVVSFGDEVYPLLEQHASFEASNLQANSVKVFADGAVESNTAALIEPYLGEYDNGFQPFYSLEDMARYFTRFDKLGFNIHVHAIGDLAIRRTLDAFAAMRSANGPSANRHVIAHLQLIAPNDRGRFAQLGITASFTLLWAYPDEFILKLYPQMIGPERTHDAYPMRDLANSGARVTGSSDWSVSDMNPLLGIETAITRRDPWTNAGPALNPGQAVDLATMIDAYTRSTAWLLNRENETGTIETGKKADLVVLDRNLFEIPAGEISDARVLMTVFDGRVVYEKKGASVE
jgi:hypothetical protein